jgi:hypothetical protein
MASRTTSYLSSLTPEELLVLDGREFIRAAYWRVLSREPDTAGHEHYLSELQAGVSKIRIVSQLYDSREAFSKGVHWPDLDNLISGSYLKSKIRSFQRWRSGFRPNYIHISRFLEYFDEDFIFVCYRNILRRHPDPEGSGPYLTEIRRGGSRAMVVADIYASAEARRVNPELRIGGLTQAKLYNSIEKMPVVGGFVMIILFIVRFKYFILEQRALQNHLYRLSQASSLRSE